MELNVERIKILNQKYRDWQKSAVESFEIVKDIRLRGFEEILTGQVDMAGQNWPTLDDKKYYIGGYGENRIIGATDPNAPIDEMRTFHIGLDIFAPARTPIYAPLDGEIFAIKNNDLPRDYGPTIILFHKIDTNFGFFTLHGHLSLDSLENKKIGQKVSKGEGFAFLGAQNENGGWPPHLHIQVILDMLDFTDDFPGLCKPTDREFWLLNCPNPRDLLGI